MHPKIEIVNDFMRGCGWRKEGALYLRADDLWEECGRLPIVLETCPHCGQGIKQARGWTWVNPEVLFQDAPECKFGDKCGVCPAEKAIRGELGRAGLLWVGGQHYPNKEDFIKEARDSRFGISRRIAAVPRDFVLGETWILVGHPKAKLAKIPEMGEKPEWKRGIIAIFKPTKIEVVVSGEESDEEIEDFLERGLTPIKINRMESEPQKLL